MKINSTLLLSTIGLFSLAACDNKPTTEMSVKPKAEVREEIKITPAPDSKVGDKVKDALNLRSNETAKDLLEDKAASAKKLAEDAAAKADEAATKAAEAARKAGQ